MFPSSQQPLSSATPLVDTEEAKAITAVPIRLHRMSTEGFFLPILSSGFLPGPWLAGEPEGSLPTLALLSYSPATSICDVQRTAAPWASRSAWKGTMQTYRALRALVGLLCPLAQKVSRALGGQPRSEESSVTSLNHPRPTPAPRVQLQLRGPSKGGC